MTDTQVENSGSFSDPSQAARLRDLLNGLIEDRVKALSPTRMTGMVLDIYQGGPTFNSDITVDSTIIPRTQDNPERPYVAKIRLDDKFEGGIVEARIDPNLIPIFRKADFFDEENPAGSGTMVDRAGRYITVEVTGDGSAPVDDTYPSLVGTTLQAPQAAPRVALVGSAASWRVSELIRGVLAIQTNPATLMLGPDYARFDTNTLTWGGTIAFARGSEIKAYEIYPDAPIVTYGSEPLEVSPTEPVEIVLGQRSGSMYLNFSATDGVPVLVWVEAGSDTPIPPEWYLVFARINDGDLSSKLVFSSLTDFRSPSAPDNLVLTYAKTGYEKLGLTASWDEVTEGTNGDSISISGYELWGMLDDEDWRRITTTTDTHVAGLTFDSSSEWHFKVRAMGQNGIPGVFSDVEAVIFPEETGVIGGGNRTYWQATKPTEGNEGDQWFDTDDGNKHYIYDSTSNDYVAAPFGSGALDTYVNNLIATAVSDAAEANGNAELAITTANGKNNIFVQTTKPTLTGRTSGDIWLDSDDGNKIYTFDGADFVPGLIGAAALADGSVIASKLAANSITAGSAVIAEGAIGSAQIANLAVDKLTGGTLQSDISLAAKIQAGSDSLGLVKLDSTGIRVIDGSGIQQTAFNTTGSSVFKGDIEAAGIEAKGKVKLNAADNEVAVNGKLLLTSGFTAPSTAPQAAAVYDEIVLPVPSGAPTGSGYYMDSFTVDPATGKWYVRYYTSDDNIDYIYRYSAAGVYEATVATFTYDNLGALGSTGYYRLPSMAVVNGVVWVPRLKLTAVNSLALTATMQLQLYSSGGTAVNFGAAVAGLNLVSGTWYKLVIGNANTTQVAASWVIPTATSTTASTVGLITVSSGATTGTFTNTDGYSYDKQITYGTFDFGGSNYFCIARMEGSPVSTYTFKFYSTAGVYDSTKDFPPNVGTFWGGIVYYSGNFYSSYDAYTGMGTITKYTGLTATTYYAYSWYDSNTTGGVHETNISPVRTYVGNKRAKIQVTTATLPASAGGSDDPNRIRIYGGLAAGTLYLQAEQASNQLTLSSIVTSGTQPGSSPSFEGLGTPAIIQNTAGTVKVDAAGSIAAPAITGTDIVANTSLKVGSVNVLLPSTGISRTLQTMSSLVMNPNSSYCRASSGWWIQEATDAYVTTGNGYPVASMPGIMEVHVKADGTVAVQRYTTFETNPRVYVRYYNGTTWGAWGPVNTSVGCRVTKTTAGPSIGTASTWAKWIGTTEAYDDASIYDTSTGVITIPTAGRWRITFSLPWSNFGSVNQRILGIFSGTAASGTPLATSSVQTLGRWHGSVTLEMNFAAGATLTTWIYATATSSGAEAAAATTVPASSLVVVQL